MRKIIRLTEQDLNILVRRVIKEQRRFNDDSSSDYTERDYISRINGRVNRQSSKLTVILDGFNSQSVKKAISRLDESVKFIAILNCENADFSDVDLCNDFPNLQFVNMAGTPNNFKKTQGDCFKPIIGDEFTGQGFAKVS